MLCHGITFLSVILPRLGFVWATQNLQQNVYVMADVNSALYHKSLWQFSNGECQRPSQLCIINTHLAVHFTSQRHGFAHKHAHTETRTHTSHHQLNVERYRCSYWWCSAIRWFIYFLSVFNADVMLLVIGSRYSVRKVCRKQHKK